MPLPDIVKDRPFSLAGEITPGRQNRLRQLGIRTLELLTGLTYLQRRYDLLPSSNDVRDFAAAALHSLSISYTVSGRGVSYIPASGPVIVVANHPFGAVDGLILTHILTAVRSDVRILGNYHLQRIPALRELVFAVDPFQGVHAKKRNVKPLRDSLRWLEQGGVLVVFPAGEVSHYSLREQRITDPRWNDTIGRLVRRTRSPVLPVYFEGRNSLFFNVAGLLHPLLRTVLLPRELINKSRTRLYLKIGKPIPCSRLKKLHSATAVTDYLRLCTYMLGSTEVIPAGSNNMKLPGRKQAAIMAPVPVPLLRAEVEALPKQQLMHESGSMQVFAARATQIPWTLQEIGRLREHTFRLAGEGSGHGVDLDLFDTYYYHLFIWNSESFEIVGAYRLGLVEEIRQRYGDGRLYSQTLFRYRQSLLSQLGPAMELGRSFIRAEYQRSHSPLNLLWKGIGRFAAARGINILFGPVSISREYTQLSRKLIIDCLKETCYASSLARRVKPLRPFRAPVRAGWRRSDLLVVRDMELVSGIIAQLEKDEKGLPILVRQYVKLGGKFLGFNVDTAFSDVVDGLIVVNLLETERRTLEKYMGREKAREFLDRCSNKSFPDTAAG